MDVQPCAVDELPVLPSDWIEYVLPHRQPKSKLIVPETKQLIVPRSGSALSPLDRCRLYLEKIPPCIAGQGGDKQLYATACAIFWDFALSEAEGMTLLHEYNTRCLPPWPESRLTYKMNEALKPDLHDKPRGHKLEESKIVTYQAAAFQGERPCCENEISGVMQGSTSSFATMAPSARQTGNAVLDTPPPTWSHAARVY